MENDSFIQRHGKFYYCEVCGTRLATDQCVSDHVNGKKHRHLVNLKVTREEQAEKSVFVGNLQKTTSELELMDYFSQYGPVSKVIMDKQKSAYAIVEFTSKESAVKASDKEKQTMNRLHISVRPREVKPFVSTGIQQKNSFLEAKKKKEEQQRTEREALASRLNLEETIQNQMNALVKVTSLTPSSLQLRYLICRLLQEVFTEFFPACRVYPYGSSVNGFGREEADLDIFLSLRWTDEQWKYKFATLKFDQDKSLQDKHSMSETSTIEGSIQSSSAQDVQMEEGDLDPADASEKDTLEFVGQILQKCVPSCYKVQKITSARKPVVKFVHKESGLHCDIVLSNRLSLRNTELIHFYCSLRPEVRPLTFTVRRWAKCHQIAENFGPGPRLTNYALTWMVIFYLQTKGFVPTVQELQLKAGESDQLTIDNWNCSLCVDCSQYPLPVNPPSIETLLKGFYEYYAKMDWTLNCLSPVSGKVVPLSQLSEVSNLLNAEQFKCSAMNIQDPLELTHNITSNVNEKTFKTVLQEFKTAAVTCISTNFSKKPQQESVTSSSPPPFWGISLLLGSPPAKHNGQKDKSEGNNSMKFQLSNQQLSDEFVKTHGDSISVKKAWAGKVQKLLLQVLREILNVGCVEELTNIERRLSDPSEDVSMEVDEEREESRSSGGKEEEEEESSGEPPTKKVKMAEHLGELNDTSTKLTSSWSNSESDNQVLMFSCSVSHEVWVGRRKIRRQLQQSGESSTGLGLEKLVTEKIISDSSVGKQSKESILEFHVEIRTDLNDSGFVQLSVMPLKEKAMFKPFYHFLEGFLTKIVNEYKF